MESTIASTKIVRGAIWVLLMLVAMGTLMMWIMMPTNTYRNHWLLSIRKKANNSTYIGTQGAKLLIYTFPVLFIATLSSVYLHLGKKLNDFQKMGSDGKKDMLARWKQPVLVKGPLGIVSLFELSFFVMFIALLVWSFSTYLHNSLSTITAASIAENGLKIKVWEYKLETAGFWLGIVGNIALAFLFFPVTRGSSVLPLFGLTSEASIKYHIWLGHIVMTLFTAHGVIFIIVWIITHQFSEMIQWDFTGVSNVAGELSLLAGLGLWLTTFPAVRRKMFEVFFYTHYLYLLFMFFFILHVGISYSFIMLPGFFLFLIDRYLRFLQSRHRVCLLSARVLPCDTLELNFSKSPGLKYNPTSIMFMNVPSISKLQWHPFTISSNSNLEPDRLSVIIKSEGSWTQKLYQILSSPSSVDRLEVSVEGPYGPVSSHFLRHDTLVMVSGGSGITPFFSIIREFIYLSTKLKSKTPQLILICAFKRSSELTMLNLLLPIAGTPSDLSNLRLQIEAYVTREKTPTTEDYSKHHKTVWLKPSPTDAPVSAILGPNSWLWLGAVIASSFVMFLILMGIITRYYIYPIDRNTNKNFSTSTKAVLHFLVMCICIAAAGSLAVLSNKSRNARDAKQIQNLSSTPAGSPSLGLDGGAAGMELESLPHQSLVQGTNVHFGERPDLKKMLFDCKGSSVGVLVCGPKRLRHDVAAICSSGLADNLHFESISFSW
ncbi:ferric reduction oxidase 2-like isoform X2 [Punica granatum]|uniref:ferric-chelate reductase (NADH) n=1 Tax=Punica granatum TaxID=22663 RepID=A0A6P8DJL5_PUNGR|nr:ferric reduction oxidase 2-like isoform X2 [Punica granatum]